MKRKKFIKLLLYLLIVIICNIIVFKYLNLNPKYVQLSYNIKSGQEDSYQVFYGENSIWDEDNSQTKEYVDVKNEEKINYTIPKESTYLRFDFGNKPNEISLENVKISYIGKSIDLSLEQFYDISNHNQIGEIKPDGQKINIKTTGDDPYIIYKIESNTISSLYNYMNKVNFVLKILICIVVDIIILIFIKKKQSIMDILIDVRNNKTMIWSLGKNDFKTKYAGSYLGIVWAFIQPIVTILVYWFVFQVGLKAGGPLEGVPFILWLMAGLVPWFFFQEALLNATNCMSEYSYLVKKVVFNISILPIVKIVSALFVHIVFVGFLFFVAAIYGFYPSVVTIQLIYYSFCTTCLVLGLSYATCAIVVFFKDLGQIINIVLQVGMWMTPIMWNKSMLSGKYQWILKLNPMYYIVEGYRDSFINKVWFFDRYFQTIYFWVIILILFIVSTSIFKRLKPHFADVL